MTKFKVGDKVRLLSGGYEYPLHGFMNGEVYEVVGETTDVFGGDERRRINLVNKGKFGYALPCDLELVESKQTKNQRITALENEVAELRPLKGVVDSLQKQLDEMGVVVEKIRKPSTIVSEALAVESVEDNPDETIKFEGNQYKKVDREAREGDVVIFENSNLHYKKDTPYKVIENVNFIDEGGDLINVYNTFKRTIETVGVYELIVDEKPKSPNQKRVEIIEKAKGFESKVPRSWTGEYISVGSYDCNVEYVVDEKKRTVVALLKGYATSKVCAKGIAKCMPGDVFNEHIGKAIALGRALGLDVSEFEQAAQPERAPEQIALYGNKIVTFKDSSYGVCNSCKGTVHYNSNAAKESKIINDTNAIY